MSTGHQLPKAHIFIDGQNLFYGIRSAFHYRQVNYDIEKLVKEVCRIKQWSVEKIHFYTGLPSKEFAPEMHSFWVNKLAKMESQGIHTVTRDLKYKLDIEVQRDGIARPVRHAREKGIDVRIAIDMITASHDPNCEAIMLFSQDGDLREAFMGASHVATLASRALLLSCAFPVGDASCNNRGITGVEWVPIKKDIYDRCIDARDYRKRHHQVPQHPGKGDGPAQVLHARQALLIATTADFSKTKMV